MNINRDKHNKYVVNGVYGPSTSGSTDAGGSTGSSSSTSSGSNTGSSSSGIGGGNYGGNGGGSSVISVLKNAFTIFLTSDGVNTIVQTATSEESTASIDFAGDDVIKVTIAAQSSIPESEFTSTTGESVYKISYGKQTVEEETLWVLELEYVSGTQLKPSDFDALKLFSVESEEEGSFSEVASFPSSELTIETITKEVSVGVTEDRVTKISVDCDLLLFTQVSLTLTVEDTYSTVLSFNTSINNKTITQFIADLSDYATKVYVQELIDALVGAAPDILDTLYELANALGNDPNFATTITNMIAGIDNRVDVVEADIETLKEQLGNISVDDAIANYLTSNNYAKKSDITWGNLLDKPSVFNTNIANISDLHSSWDALLKAQKPTTLAGYGIADGVNDVSVTGSGNVVTSASVSGHVLTLTKGLNALTSVSLATISDLHSSWDAVLKAQKPAWLTTVSLATISDLHASWDALLKSAPSAYVTRWPTAAEVGALTQAAGDGRYVKKAGDTMTGTLTVPSISFANSVGVTMDSYGNIKHKTNSSSNTWQIKNSSGSALLTVNAGTGVVDIGNLTVSGNKVWHAGNDGSGSGLDADLLDGVQGAVYRQCQGAKNRVDITVGGDANTYYPVVIASNSDHYPATLLNITRTYNETAPNSWNTSTHKGGLTLCILWNSSNYWDGNGSGSARVVNVIQFYESYSTMVGGIDSSVSGLVIWLRGGTAAYHIYSNRGTSLSATVRLDGFTDSASKTYSPKTTPSSIGIYRNIHTNATSATKLVTDRTINGTAFNGTSNIVTSYWGTARTLSLTGNATGSVSMNGSSNVSMSVNVNYATSAGNADTLDGVHNGSVTAAILANQGRNTAITGKPTNSGVQMFEAYNNGYPCKYGNVLRVKGTYASGSGELLLGWSGTNNAVEHIYYRNNRDAVTTWSEWRTLAFTTDNVASATKLQTARTIWGQSFNGTANVSGNLSGVTDINASGVILTNGIITTRSGINVEGTGVTEYLKNGSYAGSVIIGGSHTSTYGNYIYFIPPDTKLVRVTSLTLCSAGSYTVRMGGNVYVTGTVTQGSDIRLKTNISNLLYRGRLNPKTFIRDNKQLIGFIALDVLKLYPEVVIEDNDENHYLSLSYSNMTAILSALINYVEDEVSLLKKKIQELETRLSKYEDVK